MTLRTSSAIRRLGGPVARLGLGLPVAVYLTACLLPSEPPDAELIQFRLNFDLPLRIAVNGSAQPVIPLIRNGQAMKDPPAYRLVTDNPAVVQVDSTGRGLRGVARGTTSVRAVVATAIGARDTVFPVQVVVSSVFVFSDTGYAGYSNYATLTRLGQRHQFRAAALDAHGAEVPNVPFTWSSDDSLVAKLVSPGMVAAVDEGYARIWAEVDGVGGLGLVTVLQDAEAVRVAPELDTLRTVGRSISYLALVLDSANRVISGAKPWWSSSDTGVARISRLGVATATGPGTAKIIARVGGAADTATLVVAQVARFLFVSPALQTITAVADTARFTAEARDSLGSLMPNPSVTWAVDDTSIAAVDPSGLVTARRNGAVIVTATSARQSAFAAVAVRQELARARIVEDSLALTGEGSTGRLHVEGRDKNGYVIPNVDPKAFAWSSKSAFVATVDSTGVVTAHGDGRSWVAASAAALKGATDTAIVTVSGAPQELIAFTSPKGIEVIRGDGANRSLLIPATAGPAWSPDGARLAFERSVSSDRSDIYTAWADGSDTVNVTQHFSLNGQAAWSPDGSRIAFWSNRALGGGIYVMNADGSNVTLLRGAVADNPYLYSPNHPTWSPDGTRLAFDQACNVHVISADGSGLLTLTSSAAGQCSYAPAWSPDGSQLAFVSNRDGTQAIWVMNVDGSGATNLSSAFTATTPSDGSPPAWSPLGSRIVFAAAVLTNCYDYYYGSYECLGPSHLWVVSRDGTAFTQLTNGEREGGRPSWRAAAPLQAPQGPSRRQP